MKLTRQHDHSKEKRCRCRRSMERVKSITTEVQAYRLESRGDACLPLVSATFNDRQTRRTAAPCSVSARDWITVTSQKRDHVFTGYRDNREILHVGWAALVLNLAEVAAQSIDHASLSLCRHVLQVHLASSTDAETITNSTARRTEHKLADGSFFRLSVAA